MKTDLFLLVIWLNNTKTREFKIKFNINGNTREVSMISHSIFKGVLFTMAKEGMEKKAKIRYI